jgi:hypothetical protein
MPEIMPCDICGAPMDDGSHYAMGKCWCRRCFSGQRPPHGIMPPNERQRAQIAAWLRPRTSTPAAQLALAGVEQGQPQGAIRG